MTAWRACSRVVNRWPWTQAVFNRPHRFSAEALSQQLPLCDIELRMPQALRVPWKSWLQYWADSIGRRNTFNQEVFMGRPAGWMKQLTGRDAMRSPGAPSHRREVERQFCAQVATGITSEKAAEAVGVSQAVGSRWFRHRGGMPLFMSKPVSDRYLSFTERDEVGILRAQDLGVREIARRLDRSPSTVSRELTRNAATRGGKLEYRASVAQWKSELLAQRPKPAKLVTNPRLREYV